MVVVFGVGVDGRRGVIIVVVGGLFRCQGRRRSRPSKTPGGAGLPPREPRGFLRGGCLLSRQVFRLLDSDPDDVTEDLVGGGGGVRKGLRR